MAKQNLVVLTGAGVSAESGLKTFRDMGGLWEGFKVEDVATPRAWHKNPQLVLDFYNQRRADMLKAQPNEAHTTLARLEEFYEVHIVTQNVDDLHERAGSKNVLHLHGELVKMRSERNTFKTYPYLQDIKLGDKAPDGGQLRPFIVWFEEPVPMIEHAVPIMENADIFILIGTSLAIYPAAGLVDYVDMDATKYIIDKHIPPVARYRNIVKIEKNATEGMKELFKILTK